MQLILPQSELETAITEYVHGIMNIKDGNTMTIDLKAGRGLDGFTATVDIVKSGAPVPAKTVVPAAVTPVAATVLTPVKVIPRPVTKEEPVAVVVVEEVIVVTPEVTTVVDKSEQQEVAAVETKEETTAEAAPSVRRPLFGSLKKPE